MSDLNATKEVTISTWNWNGYNSSEIVRANSRQEAIELAATQSVDQKHSHLETVVQYDDGNRILIHVEYGYEFYGQRIYNQFFYFDPSAIVNGDYDEQNNEDYVVHQLSISMPSQ